uniref:Sodium sulfate co-transporter n=1 Tax=Tetraselmis sp. GSL018 TaxID=582737 RepID=A0A061S8X4_9CHLO|eukprot:CAMPEP_0177599878 /NCGR_PEP_ID=MMETSP0419_2-20121207/13267_1 /TAXON_ID=582737 /ORGANISM="Tetraselmis sp., Strain GSL018" /LENGTH=958 /DNA_ID=CAMNT_0019092719 /DNA_START=169 /DNA_END=3045 /DNA_ORIENTATION=-
MALAWDGWLTLAVMVVGLAVMATDRLGPDFVFLGMLGTLMASTVITLKEGLSGFSNSGLLTVMILFPVAEGISQTGGLDRLLMGLLGKPGSLVAAQVRMMGPVAVLSAFLNNTPIVALLVPLIFTWARGSDNIHVQKLLIPLSFASIFGGTCTLIGTSTNLVIAGLQQERARQDPSVPVFGMFDISAYGLPYAVFGIVYILIFSPWLLPPLKAFACGDTAEEEEKDELLVGMKVMRDSPVIGKTIEHAGLRSLEKVFLIAVERGGYAIPAVGPDFELREGDVLFFSGDLKGVESMAATYGLAYLTDETEEDFAGMFGSPRGFASQQPTSPRSAGASPHRGPWPSARFSMDVAQLKHQRTARQAQEERPLQPHLSLSRVSAPGNILGAEAEALNSLSESHSESSETDAQPSSSEALPTRTSEMARAPRLSDQATSPPRSPTKDSKSHLLKAVVSPSSELVGNSIRQVGFRGKINASVVAVLRGGSRVPGKLGNIVLEANDRVLLDVPDSFDRFADAVKANFQDVEPVKDEAREFMAPMVVDNGNLAGKTIQQAGLRGLPGLFLVAIDRVSGETLHAVNPQTVLEIGDVLWFSGDLEAIASLRKVAGLRHQEDRQQAKIGVEAIHRRLVQAVVASGGPLVGRTVKRSAFRTHYGAAIIAVHRQGERLKSKIGDIVIKAGDVLLLDTGSGFVEAHSHDPSFALVSEVENSNPPNSSRMWVAILMGAAMIFTQILGVFTGKFIDLFTAALLAAGGMLATGCLTGAQARSSINWDIYVTIGSAFGVSIAMEKTGVALAIANILVSIGQAAGGQIATLVAIYVATALLSNIIANNAAAAIMFPISFSVAERLGIDYNVMSVTLMLGASSCFFTPFGYQTNLMVFGAGGYRTMDFIRFGGPLQIWLCFGFALIIFVTTSGMVWLLVTISGAAAVCLALYPFLPSIISFCRGVVRRSRCKEEQSTV